LAVSCSALLGCALLGTGLGQPIVGYVCSEHERSAVLAFLGAAIDDELAAAALRVTNRVRNRDFRREGDRSGVRVVLGICLPSREGAEMSEERLAAVRLRAEMLVPVADRLEECIKVLTHALSSPSRRAAQRIGAQLPATKTARFRRSASGR
jgi:hypothetical protein